MPGKIWVGIRFCWPAVLCVVWTVTKRTWWLFHWYFVMSELSKDEAENFSARVMKSEQQSIHQGWNFTQQYIIYASLKEVCWNATLDRSTVQRWHKRFSEGRVSTEPSTTAIDNKSIGIVTTVLDKGRRIMVREIEAKSGIPQTTVRQILTQHLFKK